MTGNADPRALQAIEDAVARFRSGVSEEEAVKLPGGQILRMVRDPHQPLGMRIEGLPPGAPPGVEAVAFEPSESVPEGFPGDVPFVPGCRITITRMEEEEGLGVSWYDVADVRRRFDEMHQRLTRAGWLEEVVDPDRASHATVDEMVERGRDRAAVEEALSPLDGVVRRHRYYRDGLVRQLSLLRTGSVSGISLHQRRVAERGH